MYWNLEHETSGFSDQEGSTTYLAYEQSEHHLGNLPLFKYIAGESDIYL